MNVADFDKCKELYELSGWEAPDEFYWIVSVSGGTFLAKTSVGGDYPAYDLSYLLRKLPSVITLKTRIGRRWSAQYLGGHISNGRGVEKINLDFSADTPEDAAAKLAIELFKQGVLQKAGDV